MLKPSFCAPFLTPVIPSAAAAPALARPEYPVYSLSAISLAACPYLTIALVAKTTPATNGPITGTINANAAPAAVTAVLS